MKEFDLKAKPTPTRNPSSTLTAVMTAQGDVGWSSPAFGLKEIVWGHMRVVAEATDEWIVKGQTVRVIVADAYVLAKLKDGILRFMQAYREAIDYIYSDNPQVIRGYAEFVG